MPQTYLSGNSGSCVLGAANEHNAAFNTWSATFTRELHDVTGFGDTGRRRIPGIADISGSAGGFMYNDVGDSAPGVFQDAHGADDSTEEGHVMLLKLNAACSYTFYGLLSDIAISSTMGGDATITMNFVLASGQQYTGNAGTSVMESWDESA